MVRVVVTVVAFGVTEGGLKTQLESAGSPTQEKVTAVAIEPCGVRVSA
jgi:hypothetical protein